MNDPKESALPIALRALDTLRATFPKLTSSEIDDLAFALEDLAKELDDVQVKLDP